MSIPIFDSKKETLIQYMRRIEEFELAKKKPKYDLILEFLNDLIKRNKEYTALTEFANVSYKKLTSDTNHSVNMMNKYYEQFAEVLNIDISELETIITSAKKGYLDASKIIYFLQRILKEIDFYLFSRLVDAEIYYSIRKAGSSTTPTNNVKKHLVQNKLI